MKYYSEEVVKRLLENSTYHELSECPSIEIPEKHGPIVDVDKIPWWYDPHFNTMHALIDEVYGMQPILEDNNVK